MTSQEKLNVIRVYAMRLNKTQRLQIRQAQSYLDYNGKLSHRLTELVGDLYKIIQRDINSTSELIW